MRTGILLFGLLALLAGAVAADSTSITGPANTDDAMINQWGNSGNDNFGASTTLTLQLDSSNRVLLKYDLSGISGTVTACSLIVYYDWTNATTTLNFYRITSSWNEGDMTGAVVTSGHHGVTWYKRNDYYTGEGTDVAWTAAGGDRTYRFNVSLAGGGGGWRTLTADSMTADVQYWVNNSAANFGWMLQISSGYNGASIHSSEATEKPRLWVQYAPGSGTAPIIRAIHNSIRPVRIHATSGSDNIHRP
jgi:hypothetical protein